VGIDGLHLLFGQAEKLVEDADGHRDTHVDCMIRGGYNGTSGNTVITLPSSG